MRIEDYIYKGKWYRQEDRSELKIAYWCWVKGRQQGEGRKLKCVQFARFQVITQNEIRNLVDLSSLEGVKEIREVLLMGQMKESLEEASIGRVDDQNFKILFLLNRETEGFDHFYGEDKMIEGMKENRKGGRGKTKKRAGDIRADAGSNKASV